MKSLIRLAVILLLGVTASGVAWGAEESQVLRLRAEQLVTQGRFEEAIERAQRARQLDPSDAYAARAEGSAYLGLNRYREALAALQDASDLDPNLSQVWTLQAQAHYHLDEFEQARVALDRAEAADPNDGRMHLYRGLLLSREARDEEAAQAFDRASEADPTLSEAGLFAGRSWARADRDKAARALDRARRSDPDSEWGLAAQRELDRLGDPYERGEWIQLRAGVEYDDNVALRISGIATPLAVQFLGPFNFGERSDVRAVWDASAGFGISSGPDHSFGVFAGYRGNHHDEFDEFNLQFPYLGFYFDYELTDDTVIGLRPYAGYSWLEEDAFVALGGISADIAHQFTDDFVGRIFSRFVYNDFRFSVPRDRVLDLLDLQGTTPVPNSNFGGDARRRRDRDGWQVDAGFDGTYEFEGIGELRSAFTLGTYYERYQAEGDDWTRNGSVSYGQFVQALPFDFRLELWGSFSYYPYQNRSSFALPNDFIFAINHRDRLDKIWLGRAELFYDVNDWLTISGRYQASDQDSNVEIFDFTREIVGGYVTVRWDDFLD